MTEHICKNCHFFGRPRNGINDEDITAMDNDELVLGDLKICGYVEHYNTNQPIEELPKNIPVVVDDHGYYAVLHVPENFGCNKWQPKETPTTQ